MYWPVVMQVGQSGLSTTTSLGLLESNRLGGVLTTGMFFHSAGGWEVRDEGVRRLSVW